MTDGEAKQCPVSTSAGVRCAWRPDHRGSHSFEPPTPDDPRYPRTDDDGTDSTDAAMITEEAG